MTTSDIYHAAYLRTKGKKIGLISFNKTTRLTEIEILGTDEELQILINEYEQGGQVNAKQLIDDLGYIKYMAKKKAQ